MEKPPETLEKIIRGKGATPDAFRDMLAGPWSDEEDEEVNAFLAECREDRAWEIARQEERMRRLEAEDDAPILAR